MINFEKYLIPTMQGTINEYSSKYDMKGFKYPNPKFNKENNGKYATVLKGTSQNKVRGIKINSEMRQFFNKLGRFSAVNALTYSDLARIIETPLNTTEMNNLLKLSIADLQKFHDYFFDITLAIDFFIDANPYEIEQYEPVPIGSNGYGDYMCLTKNLEIKEYVHDVMPKFNSRYSLNFKNLNEYLMFIKKNNLWFI